MRLPAILPAILAVVAVVAVACGGEAAEPTQTASPTASPGASITPSDQRTPLTTAEIVRLLRPSVVHILIEGTSFSVFGQPIPTEGVGTGFIIDDKGHIVTNNHVVFIDGESPARKITVTIEYYRDGDLQETEVTLG